MTRVYASNGDQLFWLDRGRLTQVEDNATYYSHPSAARAAAQGYMLKSKSAGLTFWVVGPNGFSGCEKVAKADPEMRLSIRIVCREDGSYRASQGKHAATGMDLKAVCCRVVKLWAASK